MHKLPNTLDIAVPVDELSDMLVAAARELFESMIGLELETSVAPTAAPCSGADRDGVLSLVGLTGAVNGTGAVRCRSETACDLSSRFLMTELTEVDEQVIDAIGEITNMIIGGFKSHLEQRVGRVQISIPSVIHGIDISMCQPKADANIIAHCKYEGGDFCVSVGLAADSQ